jgi:hypothetical protein
LGFGVHLLSFHWARACPSLTGLLKHKPPTSASQNKK